MRPIEISVDPLDGLTDAEKRTLDEAFDRRGVEFIFRPDASDRAVARAVPVVKKYFRMIRLPLPEPPQPADWHVWRHRPGRSYDVLAAADSPVLRDLRRSKRSTPESRHQLALRAVKRVERFRRECEARDCGWWFRAVERAVTD